MNKDVIYIDTEDDITAIIGKIKASKDKIIALVPPKRIGLLQSAVNLRLLARMADNDDKHLVLVTSNKALIALSSVAQIPVAKSLQSKPEIAEIDALEIDDGEDVIDGAQLPIGNLVKTTDSTQNQNNEINSALDNIDVEKESPKIPIAHGKNDVKVPDFSRFRKKLFIGIFLAVALAGFLVWAIIFAPSATIIITAKTSSAPVSLSVKLGGASATDVSKGIIQTVSKQIQKSVSVPFTATGQENVGEKATGTVTVKNCDGNTSFSIAVNTVFVASSGQSFVNASPATVPGFTGSASACRAAGTGAGVVDVAVTAQKAGDSYNIAATNYSITGVGGDVYANGGQMSGGTTKMSTVVTAEDVQKAGQALVDLSTDSIKQQLVQQFTSGESVIADSFNVVYAEAVPSPVIGAEATSKATLTSQATFSMTAVAKSELQTYLRNVISKQINNKNQRIYSDGINKVVLSGYLSTDQGATINVAATGQIGPNIDPASIKQQVKGKRYGDVQTLLESIEGVNNVDTKFPYFWVTTVPTDINKIDVQFILQNA